MQGSDKVFMLALITLALTAFIAGFATGALYTQPTPIIPPSPVIEGGAQ